MPNQSKDIGLRYTTKRTTVTTKITVTITPAVAIIFLRLEVPYKSLVPQSLTGYLLMKDYQPKKLLFHSHPSAQKWCGTPIIGPITVPGTQWKGSCS